MKYRVESNPVTELRNLGPESAPIHFLYGAVTVINRVTEWVEQRFLNFSGYGENNNNEDIYGENYFNYEKDVNDSIDNDNNNNNDNNYSNNNSKNKNRNDNNNSNRYRNNDNNNNDNNNINNNNNNNIDNGYSSLGNNVSNDNRCEAYLNKSKSHYDKNKMIDKHCYIVRVLHVQECKHIRTDISRERGLPCTSIPLSDITTSSNYDTTSFQYMMLWVTDLSNEVVPCSVDDGDREFKNKNYYDTNNLYRNNNNHDNNNNNDNRSNNNDNNNHDNNNGNDSNDNRNKSENNHYDIYSNNNNNYNINSKNNNDTNYNRNFNNNNDHSIKSILPPCYNGNSATIMKIRIALPLSYIPSTSSSSTRAPTSSPSPSLPFPLSSILQGHVLYFSNLIPVPFDPQISIHLSNPPSVTHFLKQDFCSSCTRKSNSTVTTEDQNVSENENEKEENKVQKNNNDNLSILKSFSVNQNNFEISTGGTQIENKNENKLDGKIRNEIGNEKFKDESKHQIDDKIYRKNSKRKLMNKNNQIYEIPLFDCRLSDIKEISPSFSPSFYPSAVVDDSQDNHTTSLSSTDSEVVVIGTVVNVTTLIALSCSPSILTLPLTLPLS